MIGDWFANDAQVEKKLSILILISKKNHLRIKLLRLGISALSASNKYLLNGLVLAQKNSSNTSTSTSPKDWKKPHDIIKCGP